jgi:glutamate-1-semialdehyde aminotransferase
VFLPFRKIANEWCDPFTVTTHTDRMNLIDLDGHSQLDISGSYGVNVVGYERYKEFITKVRKCLQGPNATVTNVPRCKGPNDTVTNVPRDQFDASRFSHAHTLKSRHRYHHHHHHAYTHTHTHTHTHTQGWEKVKGLGCVLGPVHPLLLRNVELLKQISGKDEVSFHMSGTEAVMSAVRLARFNTRKPLVVMFAGAYHGWWDGVQSTAGNERVPDDVLTLTDLADSSLRILRLRGNEIAAVLVNPLQV